MPDEGALHRVLGRPRGSKTRGSCGIWPKTSNLRKGESPFDPGQSGFHCRSDRIQTCDPCARFAWANSLSSPASPASAPSTNCCWRNPPISGFLEEERVIDRAYTDRCPMYTPDISRFTTNEPFSSSKLTASRLSRASSTSITAAAERPELPVDPCIPGAVIENPDHGCCGNTILCEHCGCHVPDETRGHVGLACHAPA